MWKVTPPPVSALQSFQTSISRFSNATKARYEQIEGEIVTASNEFGTAAAATTLHQIPQSDNVGGIISRHEMTGLYNDRFAKKKSAGRHIYDSILAAAPRCPLCGHGTISTLDHHLPKRGYPALAVAPLNLVPACADCNKNKTDAAPATRNEETLHPYFDDIESDPWLTAEVVEVFPAALRFLVTPPPNWTATTANRVRHQFSMLKLPSLYASQAANELAGITGYVAILHDKAGSAGVQQHLSEVAQSKLSYRINSWQTATYTALANSLWYCGGGFN